MEYKDSEDIVLCIVYGTIGAMVILAIGGLGFLVLLITGVIK